MTHAVRMGRKAINRIRQGSMLAMPVMVQTYLRQQGVWHDLIPSVTELVLQHSDDLSEA